MCPPLSKKTSSLYALHTQPKVVVAPNGLPLSHLSNFAIFCDVTLTISSFFYYPASVLVAKYPPSCPVWYGLSSKSSSKRVDARRGVVKSVYIHEDASAPRVYKITNASGVDRLLWQDQLVYAMDCPVHVKGMIENNSEGELEGVIMCPKVSEENAKVSYSVLFVSESDGVRLELEVEADEVSFRNVVESEGSGVGGHSNGSKKGNESSNDSVVRRSEISGVPPRTFSANARNTTGATTNSLDYNPNDRHQSSYRTARNGQPYGRELPNESYAGTSFAKPASAAVNKPNPEGPMPRGRWAPNEAKTSAQYPSMSRSGGSLGKRKPPPDHRSMPPRSSDCGSSEYPRKVRPRGVEIESIFTVPMWVLQKCERDQELFRKLAFGRAFLLRLSFSSLIAHILLMTDHILGRGGEKTKYIVSRTNCFVHVSGDCARKQIPSVITIRTKPDTSSSFRDVREAIRMVTDSLKDFLNDESSEGRLMHDLARSAKGNYNFHQAF